jgi:phage terminase small subunit
MSGVNVQRMKLRGRRSESRMLGTKKKEKKEKVIRRRPESTSAVSQDDYQI